MTPRKVTARELSDIGATVAAEAHNPPRARGCEEREMAVPRLARVVPPMIEGLCTHPTLFRKPRFPYQKAAGSWQSAENRAFCLLLTAFCLRALKDRWLCL